MLYFFEVLDLKAFPVVENLKLLQMLLKIIHT